MPPTAAKSPRCRARAWPGAHPRADPMPINALPAPDITALTSAKSDQTRDGVKRSVLVEGSGIPLGWVLAGAHTATTPRCWPHARPARRTRPALGRDHRASRCRIRLGQDPPHSTAGLSGEIAHKGEKAPIQAGQRWHIGRTNAWHNVFNRHQRGYERRERVADAFFNRADAIITLRSLIRQAWTLYRRDRPARPTHGPRRPRRAIPVPDPRPRQQVHSHLLRDIRSVDPHHPHPDTSAASERHRGTPDRHPAPRILDRLVIIGPRHLAAVL